MFKRLVVSLLGVVLCSLCPPVTLAQYEAPLHEAERENGVMMVDVSCINASTNTVFIVTIPETWLSSCASDHETLADALDARREIASQVYPTVDDSLLTNSAFWAIRPDPQSDIHIVYSLDIAPLPANSAGDITAYTASRKYPSGMGTVNGYDLAWYDEIEITGLKRWGTTRVNHELGLIYHALVSGSSFPMSVLEAVFAIVLMSPREEGEALNIDAVKYMICNGCPTYAETTLQTYVILGEEVARVERSPEEVISDLLCRVTALDDNDLHTGPGTSFPVAGSLAWGSSARGVGYTGEYEWFLLENDLWISGHMIDIQDDCYFLSPIAPAETSSAANESLDPIEMSVDEEGLEFPNDFVYDPLALIVHPTPLPPGQRSIDVWEVRTGPLTGTYSTDDTVTCVHAAGIAVAENERVVFRVQFIGSDGFVDILEQTLTYVTVNGVEFPLRPAAYHLATSFPEIYLGTYNFNPGAFKIYSMSPTWISGRYNAWEGDCGYDFIMRKRVDGSWAPPPTPLPNDNNTLPAGGTGF